LNSQKETRDSDVEKFLKAKSEKGCRIKINSFANPKAIKETGIQFRISSPTLFLLLSLQKKIPPLI